MQHRYSKAGLPWTTIVYRGRSGLHELENDWRRLSAEMPLRSAFHTFEAHCAYIDHLKPRQNEITYVAVSDGERLRAICPLEATVDRTLGISIPIWATPTHSHWPLSDAIGPEDGARRILVPAVVDHLRRDQHQRTLLALGPLPGRSLLWDGVRELPPARYCIEERMGAHVFDCTRPYDELLARFSESLFKNLHRKQRRLAELADVQWRVATSEPELSREFEAFLDLEASGWKGPAGTGTAIKLHPNLVAFYRGLLSLSGAEEHCAIHTLCAEGRRIASDFCVRSGAEYACLKTCYDEQAGRLSPGMLLLRATLERCCDDLTIEQYNQTTAPPYLIPWHPDLLRMGRLFVALNGDASLIALAALRFRYGSGRRLIRRIRGILTTAKESGPRQS